MTHSKITDELRSGDGHLDTNNGQVRRQTGSGNEGRSQTDSEKGPSLPECERERYPSTKRRLLFDDTRESPQSATGTAKDVRNSDDSIIDLVGNEGKRRKRRRAEEGILEHDDIGPKKLTGSKGTRAEGTRSGSASD